MMGKPRVSGTPFKTTRGTLALNGVAVIPGHH